MKRLRGLRFSLSEHFPAARWCLALIVITFTAVVSVYKYIELASTATFSAPEVMFLIMTDVTNIVFIYLPLYLFLVSGIMFCSGFGGTEVLRCGSRNAWLGGKLVTYLVNTLIFTFVILGANLAVCAGAFGFAAQWSGDFVGFRVMMGQPASDFAAPPLPVIAAASGAALLFYAMCGVVNMLVALASGRESAAMLVSLLAGIAAGLGNMLIPTNGLISQLIRCAVLIVLSAAFYLLCMAAVRRKDFSAKKLY